MQPHAGTTTKTMNNRARFVEGARKYLGVPFHRNQSSPWGTDCIGLLRLAAQGNPDLWSLFAQVPLDGMVGISGFTDNRMIDGFKRVGAFVTVNPKPGDIIIWGWRDVPQHCGIVTSFNSVTESMTAIHSCDSVGFVAEHGVTGEWSKRLVCILTHPVLDF